MNNDELCLRCDCRLGDHTIDGLFCPMAAFGTIRLTTWVFIPSGRYVEYYSGPLEIAHAGRGEAVEAERRQDQAEPCDAAISDQRAKDRAEDYESGMTCSRCKERTGNWHQGHYWKWCQKEGRSTEFHFCCPSLDCEPA